MKKFIFMLLLITCFSCYALDEETIRNKISGSILFRDEKDIENNIKDICKLNDDFYLAYISLNDSQLIYFLDGENESWEYPEKSISFNSIKYLKKIGELDAYVGDFTYTETNQVLYIDLHPAMNWNRFAIKGPDFENIPFLIYFPSYQYPGSTLYNDIKKYNGKNKRVNALRYISFDDIKFCIVNGKRGFLINAIGDVYSDGFSYQMYTEKNDRSNLVFFIGIKKNRNMSWMASLPWNR